MPHAFDINSGSGQDGRGALRHQHRLVVAPLLHDELDDVVIASERFGRFAAGGQHHGIPKHGRRRLERAGKNPLGFLASEYAVAVWGLEPVGDLDFNALFDEDMLGDDLEAWLAESTLMKAMFAKCAVIAGMIHRNAPAEERKTGRQVSFSADLIYDVLKQYEPDHILMQAAFADAGEGYLDLKRLGGLLRRVKGRLIPKDLDHVSPFAAPVMLEMGRVRVEGEAEEAILADAARLIEEAME